MDILLVLKVMSVQRWVSKIPDHGQTPVNKSSSKAAARELQLPLNERFLMVFCFRFLIIESNIPNENLRSKATKNNGTIFTHILCAIRKGVFQRNFCCLSYFICAIHSPQELISAPMDQHVWPSASTNISRIEVQRNSQVLLQGEIGLF